MAEYGLKETIIYYLINICCWHLVSVMGEVCERTKPGRHKECPDFKDRPNEVFCCPSSIAPDTFFCCDETVLIRLETERAAQLRREFINKYLAAIICGVLLVLIVIVLVVLTVCYKYRNCPLARQKHDDNDDGHRAQNALRGSAAGGGPIAISPTATLTTYSANQLSNNRYRLVDQNEPKPAPFEAPPPYHAAHEYRSRLICSSLPVTEEAAAAGAGDMQSVDENYQQIEWSCFLDNEANRARLADL